MSNSVYCYYCLEKGHNGRECYIFSDSNSISNSISNTISNTISNSISNTIRNTISNTFSNSEPRSSTSTLETGIDYNPKNKKYDINLIYKLLWQVSQEKNCQPKIQKILQIADYNKIKIDLTVNNNMVFRCACYGNDITFAEFLLKMEPNINVRDLNDSAFINACWEHYLVGSHKDVIMLLLREQPYVYSYSFETREKKINTLKEERDARWNVKRQAVMASSHIKENDTILNKLPSELSRIVIEFLYKK
jgi:hypothetical protein